MKSIVYILLAAFIGGILISASPKIKNTQTLTIQCVEDNPSQDLLKKSVEIIKGRLEDFGLQDVDVSMDVTSSNIQVSVNNAADMENLVPIVISKGKIEFYEVYDRLAVIKNLGVDNKLASILTIPEGGRGFGQYSGVFGYCREDKKSEVDAYLKRNDVSKAESGIKFCWSEQANEKGDFYLYLLQHQGSMDNSFVSEVLVKSDVTGKSPELLIAFNESGRVMWKDITRRNIGKSIAFVLDQKVLLAPMVKSEIGGGKSLITGNFSLEEIGRIRSLISNKELPLEFKVMP